MSVSRLCNIFPAFHSTASLKTCANNATDNLNKICFVLDHLRGKFKDAFLSLQKRQHWCCGEETLVSVNKRHQNATGLTSNYIQSMTARLAMCRTLCFTQGLKQILLMIEPRAVGAVVMTLMEAELDKNHLLYVDTNTQVHHYEVLSPRQTVECGPVRKLCIVCILLLQESQDYTWSSIERQMRGNKSHHHPPSSVALSHNTDCFTRQRIMEPECVPDHNTNKCLVDKADAMIPSIECGRKTFKWYENFFFFT